MSDFLDIDEAPALPAVVQDIADLGERLRSFDAAWAALDARKKKFLETLQACNFNESKTARALGDTTQSYRRWRGNADYALCLDVLRKCATTEILGKEKLIVRHDELVESLMTEKPVLHQGLPVYFEGKPLMQIEAGAAAKVNKDLLEIGGHVQKEEQKQSFIGPPLVIQVITQEGTVQVAQINNGIEIPQPVPAFLEIDDGDAQPAR